MRHARIFAALAALLLATSLLAASCGRRGPDPYEAFAAAMDRLAGPGAWSAQSHSRGFFDNVLTVKGLAVDLKEDGQVKVGAITLKDFGGLGPEAQEPTLADVFLAAATFTSAEVQGAEWTLPGLLTVQLEGAKVEGPFVAGQVVASQKTALTGLAVVLPEEDHDLAPGGRELYEWGREFGLARLVFDLESSASYDAQTGRATWDLAKLAWRGLAEVGGSVTLEGLTGELLGRLKATKLSNSQANLYEPGEAFGDLGLGSLDLRVQNAGLFEKICGYVGQTRMNGASAETVQSMAQAAVTLGLAMQGDDYLENAGALAKTLSSFLQSPKSMRLSLAPGKPLTFHAAEDFRADLNGLLNSLRITLAANDEAAPGPLVFNLK